MKRVDKVNKKTLSKSAINLIKNIFLATFLLISITSCEFPFFGFDEKSIPSSESLRINRVELNLKGKVKFYELKVYNTIETNNNIFKGKVLCSFENIFDIDGNKIEFIKYDSIGKLVYKSIYSYDANQNHTETNTSGLSGFKTKDIIKYDINGNKVEEIKLDSDGNLSLNTIYKYDNNGNNIEKHSENSAGNWVKNNYKYDQLGNKIEEVGSDSSNPKDFWKHIYIYEGKGNPIERIIYSEDGKLSHKETYKYNFKGNILEQRDKYSRYGSGALSKHIYKYDEKESEIERYRYSLGGSIQYKNAYEYEYDIKDNWTRKVEIVNDIQEFIAERKIEYYN